jgi:hypothetical protein
MENVQKVNDCNTSSVYTLVGNSDILTWDFSSVRLPVRGVMYCGPQTRWTSALLLSY